MSVISILEEPWCFAILLGLILVLLIAAALVARQQRPPLHAAPITRPLADRNVVPVSAPLEALAALHTRLAELKEHLPPESADARWLAQFLRHLRATTDLLYDRLMPLDERERNILLTRVAPEVAALHSVVNLHLGADLRHTDHEALEVQLAALRRVATIES